MGRQRSESERPGFSNVAAICTRNQIFNFPLLPLDRKIVEHQVFYLGFERYLKDSPRRNYTLV